MEKCFKVIWNIFIPFQLGPFFLKPACKYINCIETKVILIQLQSSSAYNEMNQSSQVYRS